MVNNQMYFYFKDRDIKVGEIFLKRQKLIEPA